jgi:hypothetical protein
LPEPDDFQAKRVQLILRDLEHSLRGRAAMLEFQAEPPATSVLRGVASRAGLLRLGLRLAQAALDADAIVSVGPDGRVNRDADVGLIEITLTDEPFEERRPDDSKLSTLGTLALCGCGIAVLALLLVGLGTVASLVAKWAGH